VHVSLTPWWLPKAGSSSEEYEDACYPSRVGKRHGRRRLRVAVADGATESVASGVWADILARAYGSSRARTVSYQHLARVARRRWQRWRARYVDQAQGQGGLPWFVESGLQRGAFAALVGLTLMEGHNTGMGPANDDHLDPAGRGGWQALAVGDSCLFQVRDDELLVAFPLTASAAFDTRPALLSSNLASNVRLQERVATATGSWRSADRFYLMTDALAAWFLREHEAGGRPWHHLEVLTQDMTFATWVDSLRQSGALRNDDVTLLRLVVH
jgi:hypothetical protein